jgi:AAA+ superfamily predicted ATPase
MFRYLCQVPFCVHKKCYNDRVNQRKEVFKMKAMDKIIGYSNVKRELKQVADTLKNREAYESLGVCAPREPLVEIGRGDLVGKYVGWTAQTVQTSFKEAIGG